MIRKILTICLLCVGLAACSPESDPGLTPTLDATVLNQTAVHQATLDAVVQDTPVPTQTLAVLNTWTPIPTLDRTRPILQTPTSQTACDQAAAGHPFDVTVPDGTIMAPGESFMKTWRLENVGTCTWTTLYALTFFSGNSLGAIQNNPLPQRVEPGGVIDLTVSMEAPDTPGVYQSNWMLSNDSGELFGIGPNGDAPFWVRIEVVPIITDTPQPTPTVTSTPVVYLVGEAELVDGDKMDLDTDTVNPEDATNSDFVYQTGENPAHILLTMNGTQWLFYGDEEPTYGDCQDAELTGNAISFNELPDDSYICYRTSNALPGRLLIEAVEEGQLSISFLTWSVP